jgi:hypothetical protein
MGIARGTKGRRAGAGAQTRPVPAGSRDALCIMAAHVQETPLVFFQNKAGEMAGRIRGSVNSDPIGANLWDDRRSVAMHDQFSVLRLTGQERISDGHEIIAILAIGGQGRPYSGMAEEVVANSY